MMDNGDRLYQLLRSYNDTAIQALGLCLDYMIDLVAA